METAQSVINDALQEILVQASEQPIEAVDFQTSIRYLNRMMATFASQGINLGYTVVTLPTDVITVAAGAIEGVIFNLAVRLSPQYDMPVNPGLAVNAQEGLDAMRQIAVEVVTSSFPCTLSRGSGNEGDSIYSNDHFYACTDDELLTEQGGSILLEDNT